MGEESSVASNAPQGKDRSLSTLVEDENVSSDWLNDSPARMTLSRRAARYLSKFGWYNPLAGVDTARSASPVEEGSSTPPPSIDRAWAYFEHVTLSRYRVKDETRSGGALRNGRDVLERAEPGDSDRPTRLYPWLSTPENELGDYGIGVGMYFNTLKVLGLIVFVAGLIQLPNILYFNTEEYSPGVDHELLNYNVRGSAICTNEVWKPCPACTKEHWDKFPRDFSRFASTEAGGDNALNFIKTNQCQVGFSQGLISYIAFLFVFFSIAVMSHFQKKQEIEFDESQQTTSDYSVEVENPPKDSNDPQEWKEYFSQFGHVTSCTIAVDNEELVQALVKRRQLLLRLELMSPPGADRTNPYAIDPKPKRAWYKRLLRCSDDAHSVCKIIRELDIKIKQLVKKEYCVTNVFAVFETEEEQRDALRALSVPQLAVWRNDITALPRPSHVFRKKHVLRVCEPGEPSSIRWQDLDAKMRTIIGLRMITGVISVAIIFAGAVLIYLAQQVSPQTGAFCITALNVLTPMICVAITDLEVHPREGFRQASKFTKITIIRWTYTAITTTLIMPFTMYLSPEKLISTIYAIFSFELGIGPVLQYLDLPGNFSKHYLAPRCVDQRRMNLNFQGAWFELSERFTVLTKYLFVTFFYSAIFPTGFFFAAATFFIHYWMDKFCLLRQWTRPPNIGTQIVAFNRIYIALALLAYVVMSAYFWASFPFDNACELSSIASSDYVGTHVVFDLSENKKYITISEEDQNYAFCNQDLLRYKPVSFPPFPSDQPEDQAWMNPDQVRIVELYSWTAVAVLVILSSAAAYKVFKAIRDITRRSYKPSGKASLSSFSENTLPAYVPQVKVPQFPFPMLACDICDINPDLVGWSDPYNSYDKHNLLFDLPDVYHSILSSHDDHPEASASNRNGVGDSVNTPSFKFSVIKYWPRTVSAVGVE